MTPARIRVLLEESSTTALTSALPSDLYDRTDGEIVGSVLACDAWSTDGPAAVVVMLAWIPGAMTELVLDRRAPRSGTFDAVLLPPPRSRDDGPVTGPDGP